MLHTRMLIRLMQLMSILFVIFLCHTTNCNARVTSSFIRSSWPSVDMPLGSEAFAIPASYNAPEQYGTKYYYKIGNGSSSREFWFFTPPKIDPDAAYNFGIIGDMGQTFNSLSTFKHYVQSNGQTVLYVGDLSYADNYEYDNGIRWDTWGRFVEPSVAYQPWIWTAGNHEIEFRPKLGKTIPFEPYLHRYWVPYTASGSTSPLWYAIKRASTHIIVLSSYSPFSKILPTTFHH